MRESSAEAREVTLLELVDRLLDRGVVLSGDITISVADVDLIELGLRLVLASTERVQQLRGPGEARGIGGVALPKSTGAAHG